MIGLTKTKALRPSSYFWQFCSDHYYHVLMRERSQSEEGGMSGTSSMCELVNLTIRSGLIFFLSYCSINLYRYKRILIVSTYNPKISYKAVCDVERNFNNPSFQFYLELLIRLLHLYTTIRGWKYRQKVDFIIHFQT